MKNKMHSRHSNLLGNRNSSSVTCNIVSDCKDSKQRSFAWHIVQIKSEFDFFFFFLPSQVHNRGEKWISFEKIHHHKIIIKRNMVIRRINLSYIERHD